MTKLLFVVAIVLSMIAVGSTQARINNREGLTQIADNIVEHMAALGLPKNHAERLEAVAMVEDILIQSLHAQGYVRLEPIVVKP